MQKAKCLVTGAQGFLGKVVTEALSGVYEIRSLGMSSRNDYSVDLRTAVPQLKESFEVVIHCASKAHVVPKTEQERKDFFDINVGGTRNLLRALTGQTPRAFVFVSSIAVYGLTRGKNIAEDHPLAAVDPYGKSKIEAEALLTQWCCEQEVALVILRLPLLAGKNPPGNLNAMIRGIKKGFYFGIGESGARKSMVMADDVARIIPTAVSRPGIYHLTDGHHPSFRELERLISAQLGCKPPKSMPLGLAKIAGRVGDVIDRVSPRGFFLTSASVEKITSTLTFDDRKARLALNWQPQKVVDAFRTA